MIGEARPLPFNFHHPQDGHSHLSRSRSLAFATHFFSERGAEAHDLSSIVSRALRSSRTVSITFLNDRFTSDAISQLDPDASTALTTICEWENSFIPINRFPLGVLSLVPTYLP